MKRIFLALALGILSWPAIAQTPPTAPATAYQPPSATAPVPLAISGTTGRVALSANPLLYPAVTVINDTTAAAFCRLGDGAVVATTTVYQLYVPAGGKWTTWDATSTYVACITAGGTGTLHISQSNGAPQLSAITGSGGGGAPTGPAGGDLGSVYPNPTVLSFNGGTLFGTAAGLDSGTTNGTLPLIGAGNTLAPGVLPLATTGAFGAVKPDGTTITISAGVISSVGGGVTFANPTATAATAAVNGVATTAMRSDAAPALGTTTGTGDLVRATSPTLITPALGVIASGVGTALTALNASNLSSGTVAAARGGFAADISASSGVPLFSAGVATFTSTSGSGNFARVTSPTFVTPALGVIASGNGAALTSLTAANLNGQVAVANGGTGLASGTSGGILAYTASGTLASSAALTANLPVIGGGAGAAPTVGTRSGNTTGYLNYSGSLVAGNFLTPDASGNAIDGGYVPGPLGTGAFITAGATLTMTQFNTGCQAVTVNGAAQTINLPALSSPAGGGCYDITTGFGQSVTVHPSGSDLINGVNANVTVSANYNSHVTADILAGWSVPVGPVGSSGLTVGTTTITGGTSGRVEYNNAGVLGEMTTTGSGTVLALATSPSLTTPTLGVATATSINKMAITAPATSSTLAVADGKTFTASNTLTLTATDGSTLAIGAGGTLASAAYVATGTSGGTVGLLNGNWTRSGTETVTTAGATSAPALVFTGAPFAGTATTSMPLVDINVSGATARTGQNTNGTLFGMNAADTYNGYLVDFSKGGASKFSIDANGGVFANSNITVGGGQNFGFSGRSYMQSSTNGLMDFFKGDATYAFLDAAGFVSYGATPTLTGTCTSGTKTGGQTAGTFLATCTAQTVIITFLLTAPTGWNCNAHDRTTPADALNQTSSTTTSCTLTGTTVASDLISWDARGYLIDPRMVGANDNRLPKSERYAY